ncbi:MAG: efflux RND transporter periplasmic adaptor subunit, partial [Chloroflexi bacterium]|nr:efflux RND transporter periplasmic adaptor subunit [Chloroflexota bacterium]
HAGALSAIETQRAEMARVEEKLHRFGLTEAEIQKLEKSGSSHREFSQSTLRAPFNGVVIKYNVGEGQTVDTADELFTIADLSTVWIQANIYERDIAAIRKGLSVPVTLGAYPGRTFNCLTTYVGDVLDPKTRTARARCEVANPEGLLKIDMFATLLIPSPTGRDAVMAPKTALQTINDRSVIFVKIGETEFVKRDVDTGAIDGDRVEIKSGLKPGELVVTNGSFQLKSILLREQIGGEE